jgi:protein-tyrosine phosphatase
MGLHVWRVSEDGNLMIRGMFDKRPDRIAELKELGVTTVISMLRKRDPLLVMEASAGIGFDYRNFPLPYTATVNEDALWSAAELAVTHLREGKRVLIHCIAARDRAPTTAALTLVLYEGLSGEAARERVHSIKRTTFHNKAFVAYLDNISGVDEA